MQALLTQIIAEVAKYIPEVVAALVGLLVLGIRWVRMKIAIEKITTDVEVDNVEREDVHGLPKLPSPDKRRKAMHAIQDLHPLLRPLTEAGCDKAIQRALPVARRNAVKHRESLKPPPPAGG